jgi:hypothetical protein
LIGGVNAPNVLLMGHRLQVRRVHTPPIATEVIEFESIGDWADKVLIGEAVCPDRLPRAVSHAADPEGAITLGV